MGTAGLVGFLAAFMLQTCTIPQVYRVYKDGHARGFSEYFLWTWSLGLLLKALYVHLTGGSELLIWIDLLSATSPIAILKYYYFPVIKTAPVTSVKIFKVRRYDGRYE